MAPSSKKDKLNVNDNLKDSLATADASERRFRVRATVAVCLLSCVTVYAGKTFDFRKDHRVVFLRGNKDDGGPGGPSTAPLGAACGRENVCATGSECDGAACVACGGEFQTCCWPTDDQRNSFQTDAEYKEFQCPGSLECYQEERCLKCWKTDTDVCDVDSTCCEDKTDCIDGKCEAVTCGKDGEDCCDDGEECDGTLECGKGSCTACVDKDGDCSVGEPCCGEQAGTLVCDQGKCVDCGAEGQPLCSGERPDCDDGLEGNDDGICVKCGGPGQPCCYDEGEVSDYCPGSNLACNDINKGICVECANSGQDCDDTTPCCSEDQTCDRTGKCSACGGEDQPCCYFGDFDCNSGLECDSDFDVCQPCGGSAEPCCTAEFFENQCNEDTLICDDRQCHTCAAKGESCKNQGCCQDGTTALHCNNTNFCVECGGKDQPCCTSCGRYACDAGNFCKWCDGNTCTDNATAVLDCDK